MKKTALYISTMFFVSALFSQSYPDPEYANEVYYLKKDTGYSLVRLEKNSSKMDQSTKIMGGSETSYSFDPSQSPIRFQGGSNMVFIYSSTVSSSASSSKSDSAMRASGIDPAMLNGLMGGMTDPAHSITLYKAETSKDTRKIIMMKAPGMNPFGSHKVTSSDKYTFSVKKIRDGYWVLQVDKSLPSGEYAFTVGGMTNMGDMMGGGVVIFAFGVD